MQRPLSRRQVLKALAGLPAILAAGPRRAVYAEAGPGRFNILWIVMDTARADRCSFLGGAPRRTTPFLEDFARQATAYTHAYAAAPWTVPSHAAMFTGVHTSWHGCDNTVPKGVTDTRLPRLAEVLANNGYATGMVSCNPLVTRKRLSRGFATVKTVSPAPGEGPLDKGSTLAFAEAVDWILESQSGQAESPPFFLLLNLLEPHDPYHHLDRAHLLKFLPEGSDIDGILADFFRRGVLLENATFAGAPGRVELYRENATDADVEILTAFYDADIAYLDRQIGAFLNWTDEQVRERETLVIVTSDHGENLGEHGRFRHNASIHETLLHVPLLVRFPGGRYRGERKDAPVSLLDLFPTLADLLALDFEGKERLQGVSLNAAEGPPAGRPLFAECWQEPRRTESRPQGPDGVMFKCLRALRDGTHKFIWKDSGLHELYDLGEDPGETTSILGENPLLAERMRRQLEDFFGPAPAQPEGAVRPQYTDEERETLDALGYL